MRRHLLAAALPLAALAVPAAAQDNALPDETFEPDGGERLADLSAQLSDPVRQQEIADTVRVLSEVLLDLPLAPIIEPLSDIAGDITEEDLPVVDPDLTLRRMSPGASDLPERIQDNLPQAMDRLADASTSLAALLPALREMADRIEDALPRDLDTRR